MKYTVKELKSDILSKLISLGISPNYKDTPATSSALAEINSLLESLGTDDSIDEIEMNQDGNKLYFAYRDESDVLYAIGLTVFDPNYFRCVYIKEEQKINLEAGPYTKRTAIEKDVVLEDNNYISIFTSGSAIDDLYCDLNCCNNNVWSEFERYSSTGVMLTKEEINYGRAKLNENIHDASVSSMLYIPHKAKFAPDVTVRNLERKRIVISREYLDTAYLYIENKDNSTRFYSKVPLNQEHGLRDMEIDEAYEKCPKEVFIPPLENWEIDLIITSEKNPNVQEGLKYLAIGRDSFTYDSKNDKNFERVGFADTLETMPKI